MLKPKVLCIGSAVLDTFLTVDVPLSQVKLGDKVLVKSLEKHSGGGATNAAAALSKLGLKVSILTKLGNDHDAEFIKNELKYYNIKNICNKKSKKSTNISSIISSTCEKDRVIYAYKGASMDLSMDDFKMSQLRAQWIYMATVMGRSFHTAQKIAEHAKKKKIHLLFNPSLYLAKKGKSYLRPILRASTVLVLNKKEAQALVNKQLNIKKLLFELQKLGPEIVVITNGAKRLYALNKKQMYSLMPPKVKVVHTAGAGDAFTAGFLAGIIKKYSFEDALCLGQANASSVIQHIGTKNKLLNLKEAQKMIKKHKMRVKC